MIPARQIHNNGNTKIYTRDGDRITLSEARRRDELVATCAMCRRPATVLDHLFPYHQEMNRCDVCRREGA